MTDLFSAANNEHKVLLPLKDAVAWYFPNFYSVEDAKKIQSILEKDTLWKADTITVFGKTHPQPRLTALYGEEGKPYSYSNIVMQPNALTPVLKKIKSDIENESNATFSTVLLNLYRDGNDSNGWHSDNEKELGADPIIASLSFGEKRVFHLKHKTDPTLKYKIELEHGSLLLMGSGSQTNWKHQLPKSKRKMQPRINLTFRNIVPVI